MAAQNGLILENFQTALDLPPLFGEQIIADFWEHIDVCAFYVSAPKRRLQLLIPIRGAAPQCCQSRQRRVSEQVSDPSRLMITVPLTLNPTCIIILLVILTSNIIFIVIIGHLFYLIYFISISAINHHCLNFHCDHRQQSIIIFSDSTIELWKALPVNLKLAISICIMITVPSLTPCFARYIRWHLCSSAASPQTLCQASLPPPLHPPSPPSPPLQHCQLLVQPLLLVLPLPFSSHLLILLLPCCLFSEISDEPNIPQS